LNLKQKQYALDMGPIDPDCKCSTCQKYTRSYLHHIATVEAVSSSLLTVHNVAFQLRLMTEMRDSISKDEFPDFVRQFMKEHFAKSPTGAPTWIREALAAVNVSLDDENK
jgi:queuine tRNA-ribosyltransferase catalytic subunit